MVQTQKHSLVAGLGGVNLLQSTESTLGPDDEPSNVTTGGQLQEVQGGDGAGLDTGNVPQGLHDTLVVLVDNKGTPSLPVPPVPHLSLSSSDLPGVGNLDNIGVGLEGLQELDGLLGLLQRLGRVSNDEGNLLDLLDTVTTGEDQRGKGRGGQGRSNGVSALVLVDLDVPLPKGLGGGEHPSSSAHVSESSLSGPGSTRSSNTGDTGDGTTSTPRLGGVLVTSVLSNGVSLTTVLVHRLCNDAGWLVSYSSAARLARSDQQQQDSLFQ